MKPVATIEQSTREAAMLGILSTTVLATSSVPRSDRIWGGVIAIAVMLIASGCWLPWVARWRARRIRVPGAGDEREAKLRDVARLNELGNRSFWGVLLGQDQRLSTSKAVAFAWTTVVVYVLVVLILVWPPDWSEALKNLSPTYLLLLGGPYASLVLSKAIVSTRASSGSLVKTPSDGNARITDLIADDSGRTDLFDVQFVVFNVIAIWFVLVAFDKATLGGLPEIPNGIVLLTGGPAAVYLSNKLFSSTTATVTCVTPSRVLEGEEFIVIGSGFLAGYAPGIGPEMSGTVEVGGVQALSDPSTWTDARLRARAPRGVSDAPARVTVTGPGGVAAALEGALTVEGRPVIEGFDVAQAVRGGAVGVIVNWPPGTVAGAAVVVTLGGLVIPGATGTGAGRQVVRFTVPANTPTGQTTVSVAGSGAVSEPREIVAV
jgi:hypothetical protein